MVDGDGAIDCVSSLIAGGVVADVDEEPIEHADRAKAPARVSVRAAVIFFVLLSMMSSM
jgi:hypothetical protein